MDLGFDMNPKCLCLITIHNCQVCGAVRCGALSCCFVYKLSKSTYYTINNLLFSRILCLPQFKLESADLK